jgi:hypothetical protein
MENSIFDTQITNKFSAFGASKKLQISSVTLKLPQTLRFTLNQLLGVWKYVHVFLL